MAEKLLWMAAAPSTALLCLTWVGLLLCLSQHHLTGLVCLSLALGSFTLIGLLPIGNLLLAPLEDRFPQMNTLPANVTGIVVLGGAMETEISQARGIPTLNNDAERMTTFVFLARKYPNARLAFTGGNGGLIHGAMSEADVARDLFSELGIDQNRITYERRSRTTYENAVLLNALLKPQAGQTWLLVTSGWHMPRAIGLFRHAGWEVLAYPVAYKTAPGFLGAINGGFLFRLGLVDLATHEWIGLIAYRLLGHTGTLFPAPHIARR